MATRHGVEVPVLLSPSESSSGPLDSKCSLHATLNTATGESFEEADEQKC